MKEKSRLVGVLRTVTTEIGEVPVYGFSTYAWTYPTNFANGEIKSGIHWDPTDDGTNRMKGAISGKRTAIPDNPKVISEANQIWEVPIKIEGQWVDEELAEKFRTTFDRKRNSELEKYKINQDKNGGGGQEWYRISLDQLKKLGEKVYNELCKKAKVLKPAEDPIFSEGLQNEMVNKIITFLESKKRRSKGIAPTGLGKTFIAFQSTIDAITKGLLKNKIVIFSAPTQFLANKNAKVWDDYNRRNSTGINLVNLPIYSGSDLGFLKNERNPNRKETIKNLVKGYTRTKNHFLVLHVCNNSVKLLFEALKELNINSVDYAICDEAHTLASVKKNNRNQILFDDLVRIEKRFFLTATEKTLRNLDQPPKFWKLEPLAFMNNRKYFGDYIFKYSYADGVANGHIVPYHAKVFEYGQGHEDLRSILDDIDGICLDEIKKLQKEEDFLISPKIAKLIVSLEKIFKQEERNKVLIIFSYNSHVDLFDLILRNLSKRILGINITSIRADRYKPSERQAILDEIHESESKEIVITGPWAITGVDCPSLDTILWGFTPGNEISSTQGVGRGTRKLRNSNKKKDLLVCFNLDLEFETSIGEIKNSIYNTLVKLYEGQFPSHDFELKEKVKRTLGRKFLTVEKDKESKIQPEIRLSLDEIYNHTNSFDLIDFLTSHTLFGLRITNGNSVRLNEFSKEIHSFIKEFHGSKFILSEDIEKWNASFELKQKSKITGRLSVQRLINNLEEEFQDIIFLHQQNGSYQKLFFLVMDFLRLEPLAPERKNRKNCSAECLKFMQENFGLKFSLSATKSWIREYSKIKPRKTLQQTIEETIQEKKFTLAGKDFFLIEDVSKKIKDLGFDRQMINRAIREFRINKRDVSGDAFSFLEMKLSKSNSILIGLEESEHRILLMRQILPEIVSTPFNNLLEINKKINERFPVNYQFLTDFVKLEIKRDESFKGLLIKNWIPDKFGGKKKILGV